MNALNLTEEAFNDIQFLFETFKHDPLDGLSLLRDYPPSTLLLKNKYDSLKRPKRHPPEESCSIVYLNVLRLPDEPIKNIHQWLYINRIENILLKQFTAFHWELSEIENDVERENLIIRLQKYQQVLKELSEQLTAFKGKTINNFPDLLRDTSANWSDIYKNLNDFLPLVQHEIEKYSKEINPYLLRRSVPTSDEKVKRVNTVARDKHKQLLEKYKAYKYRGYDESATISALVTDFRFEYNKKNATNRKKTIQAIIRDAKKAGIIKKI